VNVLVGVVGHVVVDHVGHVLNVETSGSHRCCHQVWCLSRGEGSQCCLSIGLITVTVDGCGGEVLSLQKVLELIGLLLRLNKDEGETLDGGDEIEEHALLVALFSSEELLCDEIGGTTDSSHGQEDVVLKEAGSESLDFFGEGGREHEGLSVTGARHVFLFDDSSDLRLEPHIQHPIGLVQCEVSDGLQGDLGSVDDVDQTTGCGNQDVTASLQLSQLVDDGGSSVDNGGLQSSLVAELACSSVDLKGQLTGGCQNEGHGVDLLSASSLRDDRVVGWLREELLDDGKEEGGCLSRSSLGATHEVTVGQDDGERVLLNGRGFHEFRQLDIVFYRGMEFHFLPCFNVSGTVVS